MTMIVKLSNGSLVQGRLMEPTSRHIKRDVTQYLNIPYCQPPLGYLRFAQTQSIRAIQPDLVINHLSFQTSPPQRSLRVFRADTNADEEMWIPEEPESEDCLYLNIWTTGGSNKPVFVWIYGGGFVSGSSSLAVYNGLKLSGRTDCVVVSFNYRIGPLGFLNLDHPQCRGNQGIYDQIMALQWIKSEIALFGGDPENITLGGNSAGGSSVSLHLLLEPSWSTFHRVILQSGSCLLDWAFTDKQQMVQRSIDCVNKVLTDINSHLTWTQHTSINDKEAIIKILQNIDFHNFFTDNLELNEFLQFGWSPCDDGELITKPPRQLFQSGQFKKCPTVFLNTANEGNFFLLYQFNELVKLSQNEVERKEFVMDYLTTCLKYFPYYPYKSDRTLFDAVKMEYNVGETISISLLDEIISDRYFVCDSVDLAGLIADKNEGDVFYLWYDVHFPINCSWPAWVGVMHSDEIYALFGLSLDFDGDEESHQEIKVSLNYMDQMSKYFRNEIELMQLPCYDSSQHNITVIGNDGWRPGHLPQSMLDHVKFWSQKRDKFGRNF